MRKNRLFTALLLLACCLAGFAQNKYVVQIVERPNLDKQQLYEAAKRWYHLAYDHYLEDMVIAENESSGILLYKLYKRHSFKYNGDGMLAATVEISVKNGKAKFVVEDITHRYTDQTRPSLWSIREFYDPDEDRSKFERHALKDVLPEAEAWIDHLCGSFKKYVANYQQENLDW